MSTPYRNFVLQNTLTPKIIIDLTNLKDSLVFGLFFTANFARLNFS